MLMFASDHCSGVLSPMSAAGMYVIALKSDFPYTAKGHVIAFSACFSFTTITQLNKASSQIPGDRTLLYQLGTATSRTVTTGGFCCRVGTRSFLLDARRSRGKKRLFCASARGLCYPVCSFAISLETLHGNRRVETK